MLLNEFLNEHKEIEEQRVMVAELKRDFQMVSAQPERNSTFYRTAHRAGRPNPEGSAQLKTSEFQPKIVANNS